MINVSLAYICFILVEISRISGNLQTEFFQELNRFTQRFIDIVTSLDVKLFVFIFAFTLCVMDQCCIACYTVCSFFLSLPLSFWQRLIGTSCKRLRREREHLKAGKQSIVESFCGVCVVKLCCWCCAVSSSISCPRQRWLCCVVC